MKNKAVGYAVISVIMAVCMAVSVCVTDQTEEKIMSKNNQNNLPIWISCCILCGKTTDNYCIILGGLYAGNMDIVSKREEW